VGFFTVIHVLVAVVLIIAILMQAGKGGGLAEGFSSAENLLGTQTNKVMVKFTAVVAALYFIMALVLALLNARQEHSLMADLSSAKRKAVVNMEKLFDQTASQTITINAAAPTDKPKEAE
jgi:preprotein translocase subunit SecG